METQHRIYAVLIHYEDSIHCYIYKIDVYSKCFYTAKVIMAKCTNKTNAQS